MDYYRPRVRRLSFSYNTQYYILWGTVARNSNSKITKHKYIRLYMHPRCPCACQCPMWCVAVSCRPAWLASAAHIATSIVRRPRCLRSTGTRCLHTARARCSPGYAAVGISLASHWHLTGISLASHCFSLHLTASHCISLTSTAMGGSMSGASVMLILVKSISMTVFALQSWVQRARAR